MVEKGHNARSPTARRLSREALDYTASLYFDRRLFRYDIKASVAHAWMLSRQKIISSDDARKIVDGLNVIRQEIESGEFPFQAEMEDIHMAIEIRLQELIGEAADRLHTGRSRNDLIATDMRLFVMDACQEGISAVRCLQSALIDLAEANRDVVVPGYTHLQRAQPVLLAHHLLAYFEMLERDVSRLADCRSRADLMPLGAGALAGVPYELDRSFLARELGFSRIADNSLDAVADRDFIVEFQSVAATVMMHLSRLAEEIVLWSSSEFGFLELSPEFATGSSIMPQKRNPDVAELVRGKSGRVYGNLVSILAVLKGLPLAYNRDLQEDKLPLFDSVDILTSSLNVLAAMLPSLVVNEDRTRAAAAASHSLATDLADRLVERGLPFRQAHRMVQELVEHAREEGKELSQLSPEECGQFSSLLDHDALNVDLDSSIAARNLPGGTAPQRVGAALERARARLGAA